MKKGNLISLIIAFIVVFALGIFLGTQISNIKHKQDDKNTLASDKNIDFSQFANNDTEVSTELTPQTATIEESSEQPVSEVMTEETQNNDEDNDDEDNDDDGEENNLDKDQPDYSGTFDKTKCKELNNKRESLYNAADSYSNTMAIADIDAQIIDLNTYNFSNKKVAFLGDSITLGYGGNVIGQDKYFGFDDYMQEMLNIGEIVNVGEGGSTIGRYNDDSCFERRGKNDIDEDVDIIIVMGGINDFINGKQYFGDMDHLNYKETYCGSVDALYYTLRERWNMAKVFVVTPYKLEMEQEGTDKGKQFVEFVDVQRALYEKYQLNMFDLYATGFLDTNIPEIKSKLSADGTHLNNDGYKLLGQHIAADLVSYYGNKQ